MRQQQGSTLFPYTTLFRSVKQAEEGTLLVETSDGLEEFRLPVVPALREAVRTERSEEHTSELQSRRDIVCRLLLEKKKLRKSRNATSLNIMFKILDTLKVI